MLQENLFPASCLVLRISFSHLVLKTSEELKQVCDSLENSKWVNDKCYYFQNEEVQRFEDAQKHCFDKFSQKGCLNGRLYEPRTIESFQMVYKLAEEFSSRPTLTIWLGMDDNENEGKFVFSSDSTSPNFTFPWRRE